MSMNIIDIIKLQAKKACFYFKTQLFRDIDQTGALGQLCGTSN